MIITGVKLIYARVYEHTHFLILYAKDGTKEVGLRSSIQHETLYSLFMFYAVWSIQNRLHLWSANVKYWNRHNYCVLVCTDFLTHTVYTIFVLAVCCILIVNGQGAAGRVGQWLLVTTGEYSYTSKLQLQSWIRLEPHDTTCTADLSLNQCRFVNNLRCSTWWIVTVSVTEKIVSSIQIQYFQLDSSSNSELNQDLISGCVADSPLHICITIV